MLRSYLIFVTIVVLFIIPPSAQAQDEEQFRALVQLESSIKSFGYWQVNNLIVMGDVLIHRYHFVIRENNVYEICTEQVKLSDLDSEVVEDERYRGLIAAKCLEGNCVSITCQSHDSVKYNEEQWLKLFYEHEVVAEDSMESLSLLIEESKK